MADGGLAFISTRCRARFLCWRPQAFVLFRMDADGENIRPLSFANLSEWSPAMMRDGRILWTRSEYLDKGANFGHTLWAIHPDGTHPELIFGNDTINCYMNGREVPGSREICCTIFSHGGDHNGPLGLIDLSKGPFDSAALTNITPDINPHYDMSWPAQECFRDPTPISRDYFLASHAPADRWGLFVVDRYGNRELLYLDPEIGSMCATPLRPAPRPPVLSPQDPQAVEEEMGQFTLADVYQGLAPAVPRGKVKYIRVCQEIRSDAGAIAQRRVPQGPRAGVPGFLRHAGPPGERPVRLAELRGQGLVGHRAGRARRLGEFLRPGREGALFRGPRREPQRNPADAERGAVAAGRAARLRGLPRRPAIQPAAQALAGRPAAAQPARRAVLGHRGVLLRGGRPAGVERQVRFLPRRRRQAQA